MQQYTGGNLLRVTCIPNTRDEVLAYWPRIQRREDKSSHKTEKEGKGELSGSVSRHFKQAGTRKEGRKRLLRSKPGTKRSLRPAE